MASRVRDGPDTGRILFVQLVPESIETEIIVLLRTRRQFFADVAIQWQLALVSEVEEVVAACGVCWRNGVACAR